VVLSPGNAGGLNYTPSHGRAVPLFLPLAVQSAIRNPKSAMPFSPPPVKKN
jgi:hypothetical protein